MTLSKNSSIREVFRRNLKYYRMKNNLTQSELAEKVDLSDKYISDLERGLYSTSLDTLEILGRALEIEPHLLLKDDPSRGVMPNKLDQLTGVRKKRK